MCHFVSAQSSLLLQASTSGRTEGMILVAALLCTLATGCHNTESKVCLSEISRKTSCMCMCTCASRPACPYACVCVRVFLTHTQAYAWQLVASIPASLALGWRTCSQARTQLGGMQS